MIIINIWKLILLFNAILPNLPTLSLSHRVHKTVAIQVHVCNAPKGFPGGSVVKNPPAMQCRRHGFDPWVRKIPCRRAWQSTAVFLTRESHGQKSLADYSPQGCKVSDHDLATEQHMGSCAAPQKPNMALGFRRNTDQT